MFPFMYLAPFPKLYINLFLLYLTLNHSHLPLLSKSPSASRRVFLQQQQPLSAVRSEAARVVCSPSTHGTKPSSQGYIAQKRYGEKLQLVQQPQCFLPSPRRGEKGHQDNMSFNQLESPNTSRKMGSLLHFCHMRKNSALSTSFASPGGGSALIALHLWFSPVIIHIVFGRQDM